MYIKNLEIENFRNYKNQKIEFDKNINIFYGDNAQGKTNIIESIFFTAFGKSFRTSKEKEVIKKGEDFTKINLEYQKKDRDGKIAILISDKKVVSVNGIKLKKLSELIGNVNIVTFTPDDINILKSGPSTRRRFLDMMIGQLKVSYIHNLNLYLKTLEQRNNYLKQRTNNDTMLEIWDEKLAEYGEYIYKLREEFIDKISKKIVNIHHNITNEDIKIKYISDSKSKEEILNKLKRNREIDKIKGFTSCGVHRDDFKIYINGDEVNIYGSQGQNRTAILSLKLAEIEVIYEEIGEYPILLLDDFMSELDEKRITSFLSNIENIQVIITCTKEIDINKSKLFNVKDGKIINTKILT